MFPGRYAFKARLKSDCRLTLRAMRKHRVHYLFMLPYLLLFTLFTILPVIVAVLLSFTSFNMLSAPEFIGVDNYFRLFLNDDIFIIAPEKHAAFRGDRRTRRFSAFLLLRVADKRAFA